MTIPESSPRSTGSRRAGRALATVVVLAAVVALATSALASSLSAVSRARLAGSGRIGASLLDALDAGGKARVIVLFDVPGYGRDAGFRSVGSRTALASARRAVERAAGPELAVTRRYEAVDAVAGEISVAGALALLDRADVARIDLDTPGSGALAEAVPLVGLDVLHAMGLTGAGSTVAVIDSGIDTDHPDLADDLVGEQCFCSLTSLSVLTPCCPNGAATQSGPGSAEDDLGHGTHVAGIVSSAGNVAPVGGAPDAEILALKVLSWANFGLPSDWLAALDWVATNRPDVDAVNMSLGVTTEFGDCDANGAVFAATKTAVDNLRANGTLVFVASHNQAFDEGLAFPACLTNVIAVGASYDADVGAQSFSACTDSSSAPRQVACFTNSGPGLDVVAPGTPIFAPYLGGGAATLSGTSMATPLTAAFAATLRQAEPGASADEIEEAILASPIRVTDAKNGLEFPHLDCAASRDWLSGCPETPREDCREAGTSVLAATDDADDVRDRLLWSWKKGDATAPEDFADPTAGARYALCLYTGTPSELAGKVVLPTEAGWSTSGGGGFRFDDPIAASGLQRLLLRPGSQNRARVLARGRGVALPDLGSPVDVPLTVQLWNGTTGACWTSTFAPADVKKNAGGRFRAVDR